MKPARWACCSVWLTALLLLACAGAWADPVRPSHADVFFGSDAAPPRANEEWQRVALPFMFDRGVAWFRVEFDAPPLAPGEEWAVYLPYFYTGGRLFINGMPLGHIREPDDDVVVRWERPQLVPMPAQLLRPGRNQLLIRVAASSISRGWLPLLAIGPQEQLLTEYDRRLFWVRTQPQFTVVACVIVGVLALFIWWRRREEILYGVFGAAALLWGVRTLTFVMEVMPTPAWHAWRTIYQVATGGFVIALLLFAMELAGMRHPRLKWALFGYWLLGPIGYLATGGNEQLIGRFWAGGLLPVGLAVLVISAVAAWRQRTVALGVLSLSLALAVLAGIHDYLIATAPPVLRALAPQVGAHRVFLLHYAADFLLLVMGGSLAARLVGTLRAIEQLNRTLEFRVAERERALSKNYERLRQLERRHAAVEERQQIMRDLHDGLGSQLFLTLSGVEVGRLDQGAIVQGLRECIADMRLTLDAMNPESSDFLQAWGSFRFRWERLLEDAGLVSAWHVEAQERLVEISPHVILQLLRIVQEALTNAVKHAGASRVTIRVRAADRVVRIEVIDDGRGLGGEHARAAGHGLANMRARAARVGARLDIADRNPGVRVSLELPLELEPERQPALVA